MARPENDQTSRRKIAMVGSKTYSISIPIELVRQLQLNKGDTVIVRRTGERIIIEKEKQ